MSVARRFSGWADASLSAMESVKAVAVDMTTAEVVKQDSEEGVGW
jgi:hypothetical protein